MIVINLSLFCQRSDKFCKYSCFFVSINTRTYFSKPSSFLTFRFYFMGLPCEINQHLLPDSCGFCLNFVKSMYPSRNEHSENCTFLSCTVPKLQLPNLWTLWPGHQTIAIYGILKLLLFSQF